MDVILGIGVGTGSAKGVLVDTADVIVASATISHSMSVRCATDLLTEEFGADAILERGVVKSVDGRASVEIGSGAGALESAASGVADGTKVAVGIRPQDCTMSTGDGPGLRTTVAYFEHVLDFGLATSTVSGVEEGVVVQTPAQEDYQPEQKVVISAAPERVYLFDTDTGERLR